ncbi:MAG: hypothetical protein R8N23_09670 [Reichenbachiella sp.]|uniref:hypothetical protein n=1 Tax=Reichenbachiella sp. TaxID=2184521 RepID=UPI002965D8D2|nr:hypothetical protein [Reichenbachiella sp.]MDW3210126.1 hypothetical protein [Reichenbachiella sp.]
MYNPYNKYLDHLYEVVLDYRHTTSLICRILVKDVERISRGNTISENHSALILSDWTGPTEKGREINQHSNKYRYTGRENYATDIEYLIFRECGLIYAQVFELLEKFIQDCLYEKALKNYDLRAQILNHFKPNQPISRAKMPGGENLFKLLKKAAPRYYKNHSTSNNLNIDFKNFWCVISESRHALTHNRGYLQATKLKGHEQEKIFHQYFNNIQFQSDFFIIQLDTENLTYLTKRISEFAFQIYKIISLEDGFDWKYLKD